MSKKAYIVITHSYKPNPDSTDAEDKWTVVEQCEFVNSLKNRMLDSATAIIDYTNKSLYKNRVEHADYDSYISHVEDQYPEKFKEFKRIVSKTLR